MGCILSAASCCEWWMNVLQSEDYSREETALEKYMGETSVFFLPYLMGERSPHNDVNARGCFIGMRPDTTRAQMTLAVMEGVAFALRDCVEVAKDSGASISCAKICGGGAKSEIWRNIIANVFGVPVYTVSVEEGPAYGAAILAMVGAGEHENVEAAIEQLVTTSSKIDPDDKILAKYNEKYNYFKKLYPSLKDVFALAK